MMTFNRKCFVALGVALLFSGCNKKELEWENPPGFHGRKITSRGKTKQTNEATWDEAQRYCAELERDGHKDWRLPTIDELRTLVRGCPPTAPEGACRVREGCLSKGECYDIGLCRNALAEGWPCKGGEGPSVDGYYLHSQLETQPAKSLYWSSSVIIDAPDHRWGLYYYYGTINDLSISMRHSVRCVR